MNKFPYLYMRNNFFFYRRPVSNKLHGRRYYFQLKILNGLKMFVLWRKNNFENRILLGWVNICNYNSAINFIAFFLNIIRNYVFWAWNERRLYDVEVIEDFQRNKCTKLKRKSIVNYVGSIVGMFSFISEGSFSKTRFENCFYLFFLTN